MSDEHDIQNLLRSLENGGQELERKTTPTTTTFVMRISGIITGFSVVGIPALILRKWDIVRLCFLGGLAGFIYAIYLQRKKPLPQIQELKTPLSKLFWNLTRNQKKIDYDYLRKLLTTADLMIQNVCLRITTTNTTDSDIIKNLEDAKSLLHQAVEAFN